MKESISIVHDWVHTLTLQQQALLMTGMRGPDGCPKECLGKIIVRYLRGVVLKPAGEWDGGNGANCFMWGDYDTMIDVNSNGNVVSVFDNYAYWFWNSHDDYPHHFIMHLVHCAEVVGYKHPDDKIRQSWLEFYMEACEAFHMNPETEEEMDKRLNDFKD